MKTKAFNRFVIALFFRYIATATCNSQRTNVAKVISWYTRGGSTTVNKNRHDQQHPTQQRRNMTTAEPLVTKSWLPKFQLRLQRNNHNATTTVSGKNTTKNSDKNQVPVVSNHSDEQTRTVSSSSPVIEIIDSQNSNKKKTGWFQQRQPWKSNATTTASTNEITTTTTNRTTSDTPTKRRFWQQRSSTKTPILQNTTTTTSTTPKPTTHSTNTATSAPVTSDITDNNTTGTSREQQLSSLPSNNNGVIVIGSGLVPQQLQQQYYRGQPIIVRGSTSTTSPGTGMIGTTTTNPTNSVAIVLIEFLTSIVGKAMYLWFFTWLTKRLAQQEEGMIVPTQHYVWERLNDRYCRDAVALQTVLREPPLGVSYKQWHRQHVRKVQQSNRLSKLAARPPALKDTFTRTVVVVEISTSGSGSSSSTISDGSTINFKAIPDAISFLIQQQRRHAFGTAKETGGAMPLEIVFLINSPGGEVSTYGLAAAQMRRLKNQPNITTTVCVDKYAASGGFMIASQADKLVAAPFATIGSVGVIIEGLNFYELAKRYGIQPMVIKAGESKNPLTQWGPVTRQDLAQEQSRLEKVHDAFKDFVTEGRPGIVANAQQVMDGSVYLGVEAQRLGLIDAVMTTDEYIFDRIEAGDRVLRLHRSHQGRFTRQLRLSPLDILPHLRSWLSSAIKHFTDSD